MLEKNPEIKFFAAATKTVSLEPTGKVSNIQHKP